MKLKENLRFLRRKAGYTQTELAKKMHLRQYNISDYEIGRIEPNIQTLIKFADIFNVSVDFIICRKGKDENETDEFNINKYVDEMHLDKYLMTINDAMKDLPEDKKKKVVDAVLFLVHNYD